MSNALSEAILQFQNQRFKAAEKACGRALKQNPRDANAHHLMSTLKARNGDIKKAVRHSEQAVSLAPSHVEARFNLAKGYRDLGRHTEAISANKTVLKTWPDRPEVWVELAVAQSLTGQIRESVESYQRAIDLGDARPDLFSELGHNQLKLHNFDDAEKTLQRALDVSPTCSSALINLAILRENQGRADESIQLYENVQSTDPNHKQAEYRRALTLLLTEKLMEGWAAYASRHELGFTATFHGQIQAPYWSGENLSGKSMAIWTEQGPGDEILLGTMLCDPALIGMDLTIACSPRIAPLFARSFPSFKVVERSATRLPTRKIGKVDFQASLSEIGAVLRPSTDRFPDPEPYLLIDQDHRNALRAKYSIGDSARPVIGLAWRSVNEEAGSQKSTKLLDWAPVLRDVDAHFVSLQYGDTSADRSELLEKCGISVIDDSDVNPLKDMDSFVHQVAAMDLVISTSNTTVHAAGATGTECWALLAKGTGQPWYWFLDHSKSFWYPVMHLYRQTQAGDWTTPLSAVRENLAAWKHR